MGTTTTPLSRRDEGRARTGEATGATAAVDARAPAPSWIGGFRPLPREHGFEPLRVEGALPPGLVGTLFRNGPGRWGIGAQWYRHWFDGDGAISAVRFDGRGAFGAARLVRTTAMQREERAGKRLFGGYDMPLARPVREALLNDRRNPANTSVLLWQRRLFATCEAGNPYEIAPDDLRTIGESDLGGVLRGAFSAHPHRVAARRCTYDFGLTLAGRNTRATLYALPDDGPAARIASFDLRGVRMCHDFVVTDRYAVFVLAPLHLSIVNVLLLRRGPVSSATWRPQDGTEIVVVPLDAPALLRRFRVEPFLLEHVVNAFEDGGEVVLEYTHYANPSALEASVRGLPSGVVEGALGSVVRRARVDPMRDAFTSETILARPVELPRVAPSAEGRRHRFAYYGGYVGGAALGPMNAVLRHDVDTGQIAAYVPGRDRFPGEGVIVPKPGGTREDDAWLLTMVYDARDDHTRLDVLEARAIEDGPIASCHFDHRIPFGFHGAWSSGSPS